MLPFDAVAATVFDDFRKRRIRIGVMDLRIAAIAFSRDMTVLTRNVSDFRHVPGLKVEALTVRSNSSESSGLKSRPRSCPYALVA